MIILIMCIVNECQSSKVLEFETSLIYQSFKHFYL